MRVLLLRVLFVSLTPFWTPSRLCLHASTVCTEILLQDAFLWRARHTVGQVTTTAGRSLLFPSRPVWVGYFRCCTSAPFPTCLSPPCSTLSAQALSCIERGLRDTHPARYSHSRTSHPVLSFPVLAACLLTRTLYLPPPHCMAHILLLLPTCCDAFSRLPLRGPCFSTAHDCYPPIHQLYVYSEPRLRSPSCFMLERALVSSRAPSVITLPHLEVVVGPLPHRERYHCFPVPCRSKVVSDDIWTA